MIGSYEKPVLLKCNVRKKGWKTVWGQIVEIRCLDLIQSGKEATEALEGVKQGMTFDRILVVMWI